LSLVRCFADVPDPRIDRTKRHKLVDILVIALCAVIAGADTWEEVEQFGRAKHDWLKRFLELPHGIPSHDTFYRVFAALDPQAFGECFGRWMAAAGAATGLKHIAIDGKAVRGTPKATASGCLHLVSAWATANHLTLGQEAVADGSNEIAAIPELLRVLDLAGALVTIDAAGCQTDIARQIRSQGGHYLLAVKDNQPRLHDAVRGLFEAALTRDYAGCDTHATRERGHGRQEERYVAVAAAPAGLPAEWSDVAAVVEVTRQRTVNGKTSGESHYYVSSVAAAAAEFGRFIREHWSIENGLHWVLDVAFREDERQTRAGHAGENLGRLRRVATSLLKAVAAKGSIKAKRLRAGWDDAFLLAALQGITEN
jgi:predicted transposase YbfD/YdcC